MPLRYYQEEAVTATLDYLINSPGYDRSTGKPIKANPLIGMPTGTGKSLAIAETARRIIQCHPPSRIIMATDSKELVRQNAEEMLAAWPDAPLGIFSAGLRKKEYEQQITFGGIGTLVNSADKFGHVDFVGIDEAHMVSDKSSSNYQKFLSKLREVNPYVRTIGWTATYWRQGSGLLTDGELFTKLVYSNCGLHEFNRLIAEGFLAPLIVKPTHTELDTSSVGIVQGEFNQAQLQEAVDNDVLNKAIMWEAVQACWDRSSWLVFTSGVEHTEHCAKILQEFGIACAPVHSKRSAKENDANIAAFKRGELRAMVGNNMFIKGFNHKPVDAIVVARPTRSTALWVQMLGRGTRPSLETGKRNCLVLDFAQNAKALGPINDPVIPKKRKKGDEPGEMPVKLCSACGCYNHARAVCCEVCGAVFPKAESLSEKAGTHEVLADGVPEVNLCPVSRVVYDAHNSRKSNKPSLKVMYHCGFTVYTEYVTVGQEGLAGKKARDWWRERSGAAAYPPETVFEAQQRVGELVIPKQIRVWVNKQYPEIVGYEWQ